MQRGDSEIGAASFIDYLNAIMTCFSLGVANYALIKLLADELLAVLDKDTLSVSINAYTHHVVDRSVFYSLNC